MDDRTRQLTSILDHVDAIVFVSDPQTHTLLYVNESFKRLWGDAVGQTCHEVICGADTSCEECDHGKPPAGADRSAGIRRFHDITGRWFRCTATTIPWPDGRIVRCETAFDISDARNAEIALKEGHRKLSTLMDTLDGMVYRGPRDRRRPMDFASDGCRGLTGYPARLLTTDGSRGVTYGEIVHPDDRDAVEQGIEDALQADKTFRLTYRIHHASGHERWVWEQGRGIRGDDGRLIALEGFITDVTERRQAEAHVLRLAGAFEAAANPIVLTDENGLIEQVNPAFTEITGFTQEEVAGQTPRILKSGKHSPTFYERLWSTIKAGKTFSNLIINRRKDGSIFHADLTVAPICNPQGDVTGFVGVHRDITESIQREETLRKNHAMLVEALHRERRATMELEAVVQQLEAATQDAQAATQAKSEFLAKMSHELRTPLNSIIGFTDLMIDDAADPPGGKRARRLEKVERNARNLLALINDILDISKVEAGKLTLEHEVVNVPELITECVESIQPLLPGDRVDLRIQVDHGLRDTPHRDVDPIRLRQILTNLLSNAAKFTESGAITVRATGSQRGVQIAVEDTGIGMNGEYLPSIFDEFQQVDSSSTRRAGGTGLGLAICRKLTRMMGGTIGVTSTPGVGSCFTVTLPLPARQPNPRTTSTHP